ncbi:MAG: cupin domain-containing protein [Gemmatimonadales bacterium]
MTRAADPLLLSNADDTPANRPEVIDLETGPEGRSFRLRFQARQALPPHHNPERVVITTERGTGTLHVDGATPRRLEPGVAVQLEPRVRHAVSAGDEGLELVVSITASCCRMC